MKDIETQYYGQCEHLDCMDIESDDCLKRYFIVNDYKQLKRYRLAICNDYLKLLIHKGLKAGYCHYGYRSDVHDIISKLVKDHTKVELNTFRHPSTIYTKFCISLPICERPFISMHSNFFDALKMLIESSNSRNWMFSYEVKDAVINSFSEIKNYMGKYMKYKSSFQSLKRIEKSLKSLHFSSEEEVNQILIEIMDLMIKQKVNKL